MSDGRFGCEACGRRYRWKAEIAGRTAKCACGAGLRVPETDPAAEQDDGLYDFAEPDPTPVRPAVSVAAPAATATAAAVAPLAYRGAPTEADRQRDRFRADNLVHPPRDLYVPVALLVAGFLAMLAWAVFALDAGAVGIMLVSAFTGGVTVIKTAVIIGLALIVAPMMGISFGSLNTAILKFAAIIIFTDAAMLWLDVAIGSVGGRMTLRILFVELIAVAAIIGFLCHYLFDMDGDETRMFALPMAGVSWLLGLILDFAALAVLRAIFD